MSTFEEILQPLTKGSAAEIPAEWGQGRATFGGLVAAAGLRAMRRLDEKARPPRVLMTSFVAPLPPGAVEVEADLLRSGSSVAQIEARVKAEGRTCATVHGAFGLSRETELGAEPLVRPSAPPPEEGRLMNYIAGLTPEFLRYFEFSWLNDAVPYSGTGRRDIRGYVRFRDPGPPTDEESIAALVDAWPTPLISGMKPGSAASSLSWSLEFVHVDPSQSTGDWWYYEAKTDAAANGYAHVHAEMWDPSGRLAACSRQTVAYFPR